MAAPGETDSEGRGDGRLADAALPHDHDQPVPGAGEVVDEPVEARQVRRDIRPRSPAAPAAAFRPTDSKAAKRRQPDHVEAPQRNFVPRQTRERRRHGRQRLVLFALQRPRPPDRPDRWPGTAVDREKLVARARGRRNSAEVRAASRTAPRSARVTRTIVVRAGSARAPKAPRGNVPPASSGRNAGPGRTRRGRCPRGSRSMPWAG